MKKNGVWEVLLRILIAAATITNYNKTHFDTRNASPKPEDDTYRKL